MSLFGAAKSLQEACNTLFIPDNRASLRARAASKGLLCARIGLLLPVLLPHFFKTPPRLEIDDRGTLYIYCSVLDAVCKSELKRQQKGLASRLRAALSREWPLSPEQADKLFQRVVIL